MKEKKFILGTSKDRLYHLANVENEENVKLKRSFNLSSDSIDSNPIEFGNNSWCFTSNHTLMEYLFSYETDY